MYAGQMHHTSPTEWSPMEYAVPLPGEELVYPPGASRAPTARSIEAPRAIAADIRLLGSLEVYLNGAPYSAFRTHRVRTLLAFMACHLDIPQDRGALMELLWPTQSTTEDMRQTISRLRKVLESSGLASLLLAGRQTLCLNSGTGLRVDVAVLRHRLSQWQNHCRNAHDRTLPASPDVSVTGSVAGSVAGRIAGRVAGRREDHSRRLNTANAPHLLCPACLNALEEGLALYRGDLCQDIRTDYSEELTRWHTSSLNKLRQEVLQALHAVCAHFLAVGDLAEAELRTRRLLELDPFDEGGVRLFLSLVCRRGQYAYAIDFYTAWSRRLRQEMGLLPELATRTLADKLAQLPSPSYWPQSLSTRPQPATAVAPDIPPPAPFQAIARGAPAADQRLESPSSNHPHPTILPSDPGPQASLKQTLELLSLPECRLLTLCYNTRPPSSTWLESLFAHLQRHHQGQLHILALDPDINPRRYAERLSSVLPEQPPTTLWHGRPILSKAAFRPAGVGTLASARSPSGLREPILLIQLDGEPHRLDAQLLLDRLESYPQLRILNLASTPLRLQVEHRLHLLQ